MTIDRAMRLQVKGPSALLAWVVTAAVLWWAVGCQSGSHPASTGAAVSVEAPAEPTFPPSPIAPPTPALETFQKASQETPQEAPIEQAATEAVDLAGSIREAAFLYWETFNSYKAEQVLAFLEPVYRAAEEADIRRDIRRMKLFGVKLALAEESAPVRMESGEWEMYLEMATPIGSKRIRMTFAQNSDGWLITYSDEAD